jgi:hypothetical protein
MLNGRTRQRQADQSLKETALLYSAGAKPSAPKRGTLQLTKGSDAAPLAPLHLHLAHEAVTALLADDDADSRGPGALRAGRCPGGLHIDSKQAGMPDADIRFASRQHLSVAQHCKGKRCAAYAGHWQDTIGSFKTSHDSVVDNTRCSRSAQADKNTFADCMHDTQRVRYSDALKGKQPVRTCCKCVLAKRVQYPTDANQGLL